MNIIELAKQAALKGYQEQAPGIDGIYGNWKDLEKFAELVAAQEREACAKVCESYLSESPYSWGGTTMAEAIRARGTT